MARNLIMGDTSPQPAAPRVLSAVAGLRASLWDAGFRPVAIYNADSRATPSPGKAPKGDAWTDRARKNPPDAANASPEPDALNTGILCDGLRAIDIDIDNPQLAALVRSKALSRFGECPMRIRPNSPRCLLLYRAAEGEPKKRSISGTFGKVEILGRGQQFVAFGGHPSGGELSWMPETPGEVSVDSLPSVTETDIAGFLAEAAEAIGARPEARQTDTAANPQSSSFGLRGDGLQVVAAMMTIQNSGSSDWEFWNRIGMATWAATGGSSAGRAAFHAWSEQNPAYDAAETDRRWLHYNVSPPTQIGAGTLFHMAKAEPKAEPENAPATSSDLPLLYFQDIQPVSDVRDFVQGVLIEQGAGVVYGESNAGKTFWTTDLALHVATGNDWNGRRVERGGVVYAVLEGGIGFRNRVAAWKHERGLDDTPNVPFVAIPSGLNLLDPNADTPRLVAAVLHAAEVMKTPVKLIVIDTLSRAMAGGNENSPEDMGALVMNMDTIRAATGAAVLWVHHSGKDQAKGARGHSSLRAAIDTEIEVVAEQDSDRKAATAVKQREMKKGDVFPFTLRTVVIGTNRHGEEVTTCVVEGLAEGRTASAVPNPRLSGHSRRALDVLGNLLARAGKSGHGIPYDLPSVPEDWWRKDFYAACPNLSKEGTTPEAQQEAKRAAFVRALGVLLDKRIVGLRDGRAWLPRFEVTSDGAEMTNDD